MCLWPLGRGADGRQGGTDGDHTGGQQDDDEDDDDHHNDDDHDQLDVLPPVGARHLLRRLLEVLRLHTHRFDHMTQEQPGSSGSRLAPPPPAGVSSHPNLIWLLCIPEAPGEALGAET